MKTFRLKWKEQAESTVVCRKHALKTLGARTSLRERGAIVFTDSNVAALYGAQIGKYLDGVPLFAMPAGEAHKNGETLFSLLRAMAAADLRRNSVLIALGGGVVGDIGGLAASLYMRGIDCIQVPTTLLAQVDSSVGGKTAVDLDGIKNLVGAFHQPKEVIADPAFLATLPARELRCGLGEIVKHGALSASLFSRLWEDRSRLTDLGFLASLVPENIAFKASVVRRDPTETGLRKMLNLGHTTAHAIELSCTLSHGECVLLGLIAESRIAAQRLTCDPAFHARLEELCRLALGSVPRLPDLSAASSAALLDKKNRAAGRVTLTVPVGVGEYALLELPLAEYAGALGAVGRTLC